MIKRDSWLLLGRCVGSCILLLLAQSAHATISGKVFRDFNANGVFDASTTFNEVGYAGVTVKAFDSDDTAAAPTASVTSGADGSYTLTGLTAGKSYRLEFSWSQSWLKPGASSGNTLSAIVDGTTGVDFAVNNPAQYCQSTPNLAAPRFIAGDPNNTTLPVDTVFSFSYAASGYASADKKSLAKKADVGSIWGVAYDAKNDNLLLASALRRHSGMGPNGAGAIYVIGKASATTPVAATKFYDLTDFGIDVGTVPSNATRGLGSPANPSHDKDTFALIGAAGLGDIELSEDGSALYVVNLNDRKIYQINMQNLTEAPTVLPMPSTGDWATCNKGIARPWGLKAHDGGLYVGVVCSAETAGAKADLVAHALVYKSGSWTNVLSMPLTYPRETPYPGMNTGWNPWRNTIAEAMWSSWNSHPTPIFSDIEFDENGNMILGFMDRVAMQYGFYQYGTDTTSTSLYTVVSGGDILRATAKADGTFTPETITVATDEFFKGDSMLKVGEEHREATQGGLAVVPGTGQVVSNGIDPILNRLDAGGIYWLNTSTGEKVKGFEFYRGGFAKSAGMGDIEVMCNPAPLEVGDRIWHDTNEDGIQQPGEAGIDGVAVTLVCGTDQASVTTANGGQFLFSNKTGGNATFMGYGESCVLKVASTQTALSGKQLTLKDADGIATNDPLTDVRDSDAVDNAGTAEIAFTTGNVGENNHSLDIGYKSGSTISFDPPAGPDAFSCAANVRLATSVHVNGDSQAAGSTGAAVNSLITFDYAATGELAAPFSKATAGQVGAVWGLAYDTPRQKLYAAAFLKRHASFGPNGIGAIYQMDGTSATPTPSLLIDLAAQGVDVGTSPRVPASGAMDDPNELPADASQPSWDRDAFAQVGKISIGDIDISADGKTLWAINLKQRELVEIDLATTTVKAQHPMTDPGCSNGEFRPWAVKVHDGKVWVGSVCSAETSQQASDLKAYVQAFDGTSFTTATSFALNYPKGSIGNGPGDEKWQPWKDTYTTLASGDFAIYPQPILSDIEFDMDGSLILGFMDRMGHQVGGVNYTPNYPDDDTMIQGQTGGDIIRVCNNGGKYELENNATCTSGSTAGKDKGQGPGNGEYYWGDMWDFNPWNADGGFHQETSFGGLAFKAGSGEIALSAMNPLNPNANAGGVIWLDNATGGRSANQGVQVYRQQDGTSPYFGKASGMGDVELFCAEAALQPDLNLTKVADKVSAKRGETVVYTLTVNNAGAGNATGVVITDKLPAGVKYVSDDGAGAYVVATGVWSVGDLATMTSKTLKITVILE